MAKVAVSKIDAARRQIDTAIRMTFAGDDPVAIHSVAGAGHRIIRDICAARGDIESYLRLTDWIAEGHEAEFWYHFNASVNFLKHADRDGDKVLELDEDASDFLIALASKWYRDLGHAMSIEMRVFGAWFSFCHPKIMSNARKDPDFQRVERVFNAASGLVQHMPRADRLNAGLTMLEAAKADEEP